MRRGTRTRNRSSDGGCFDSASADRIFSNQFSKNAIYWTDNWGAISLMDISFEMMTIGQPKRRHRRQDGLILAMEC